MKLFSSERLVRTVYLKQYKTFLQLKLNLKLWELYITKKLIPSTMSKCAFKLCFWRITDGDLSLCTFFILVMLFYAFQNFTYYLYLYIAIDCLKPLLVLETLTKKDWVVPIYIIYKYHLQNKIYTIYINMRFF